MSGTRCVDVVFKCPNPLCRAENKVSIPIGCEIDHVHLHDVLITPLPEELEATLTAEKKLRCVKCKKCIHIEYYKGKTARYKHILEKIIQLLAEIIYLLTEPLMGTPLKVLVRTRDIRIFYSGIVLGTLIFLISNSNIPHMLHLLVIMYSAALLMAYYTLRRMKMYYGLIEEGLKDTGYLNFSLNMATSPKLFISFFIFLYALNTVWMLLLENESAKSALLRFSGPLIWSIILQIALGHGFFLLMLPRSLRKEIDSGEIKNLSLLSALISLLILVGTSLYLPLSFNSKFFLLYLSITTSLALVSFITYEAELLNVKFVMKRVKVLERGKVIALQSKATKPSELSRNQPFKLPNFLDKDLKTLFEALFNYCMEHRKELYEEFNQCPWFVDHGFDHVRGVLSNLDGILLPRFQKNPSFLNSRELFYLLCAALLHDIGMCYTNLEDKYGERSLKIRKNHGIYSAEMLLKTANVPIVLLRLPLDHDERKIIAEIIKYHQSDAPLTSEHLKELRARGKKPLLDEPLRDTLGEDYEPIRLKLLAALLRLADACDINYRRAKKELYDEKLRENKREVKRLKEDLVEMLYVAGVDEERVSRIKEENNLEKIKNLSSEVLKEVEEESREKLKSVLNKLLARMEIISIQEEHYPKHQAVANVYFVREYILIEPYGRPEEKWLDQARKDIEKEIKVIREILEPHGLKFKGVVVLGDDTCKKEGLRPEEDPRLS